MLVISQKKGQVFRIGRDITVTVLDVTAGKVRLGIDAPRSVPVVRLSEAEADALAAASGSGSKRRRQ